jgi:signal transduction histidine kinase
MSETVRPRFAWTPKRLALQFAIWTGIAALLTVHQLLTNRGGFPLHVILMRPAFNYWTCALFSPLVVSWAFAISAKRLRVRIPLHVLGYAVFHILYSVVRTGLAHFDDPTPDPYWRAVPMVMAAFEFQNFWLYIAQVVAAQALVELDRRTRAAADAATLALKLKDSELRALKMQLQPHFLFNTLHSIGILMERDATAARTMMVRLSDLLRHSLQQRAEDRLTLRSELELLDRYVAIEKLRFRSMLDVRVAVDAAAADLLVPGLTLQPLVENAIRHGHVEGRPAEVTIRAHARGASLVLSVEDNGRGFAPGNGNGGHGVGLKNLEARLRHLYDGRASLTTGGGSGGARVTVELPAERWEGDDA